MLYGKVKIISAIVTAIGAISCASILIRLTEAPALTISFYRVLVGASLYLPFALKSKATSGLRYYMPALCFAGVCLAAHFGFWISSLRYTSIASSVSLVNTSPILVALFYRIYKHQAGEFGNRPGWVWVGIIIGILGSIGLAGSDFFKPERHSLFGDFLAFMGAISLAGYLITGRLVGSAIPIATYLACVYGISAIVLLCLCIIASSTLFNFPLPTYLMLTLIGIVPQGIGHSLINWSLRHLPATIVSLFVIAEPIGATILAALILREYPAVSTIAWMTLIVVGISISQIGFSKGTS